MRLAAYEATGQTGLPSHLSAADWNTLGNSLTTDGPKWLDASAADRSRRLGVLGAFVLDVSRGSVDRNWPAARAAIEWICAQYRRNGDVTATERLWHLAALTLIEGAGDERFLVWEPAPNTYVSKKVLYGHLAHAEARIGPSPWLALARATAHERETYPERPREAALGTEAEMKKAFETIQYIKDFHLHMGEIPPETILMAREYERRRKIRVAAGEFLALRNHPDAGVDAVLRAGVLLSRVNEIADALTLLEEAARRGDPFIQYVAHFYAARIAERAGHAPEAMAHYRMAMSIRPDAQSAPFALSALLARADGVDEARELVARAVKDPSSEDPAKRYGSGTLHLWPERIATLRRAAGVGAR
jgi:tetratricopeptide (TPR) repeat protein